MNKIFGWHRYHRFIFYVECAVKNIIIDTYMYNRFDLILLTVMEKNDKQLCLWHRIPYFKCYHTHAWFSIVRL